MNAHQRIILAEEDFNTQFTHSVNTSQSFSPVIPVIIQRAHEKQDHGGRDRGYAWAQQNVLLLTKASLATATPGVQLANSRD